VIAEMKRVSERIKQSDERIAHLDAQQRELLLTIPNVPHSSVPVGHSAEENVEIRRWVSRRNSILCQAALGGRRGCGILDLSAAAKITAHASPSTEGGARGLSARWQICSWSAYARARLHGNSSAVSRKHRVAHRRRSITEVRR